MEADSANENITKAGRGAGYQNLEPCEEDLMSEADLRMEWIMVATMDSE